jgi:non-canonical purine NTP pyrophosphatase (RdgB/HAM1 family)
MQTKVYFITGNKNKFLEIKAMLPEVEQLELDLDEIQETDARKIIEHKMKEALKKHQGPFIIEDTSLYIKSLNELPGPLIKWFMQKLGAEGIWRVSDANKISKKELLEAGKEFQENSAEARTIIGYAKNEKDIHFFEGSIKGEIVKPTGETSFGWDPIFKPKGYDKTFQEMTKDEKNKISMRRIACEKLKAYLKKDI